MRPTPLVQTVSGRTDCIRNDTTRPGYHRRSDWLSDGRWFDDLSIPTTDLWIPTNDLGIPANEFSEPIAPVRRRNYDDLQGKADDLEGPMISKVRNETLFLSNYSGSEAKAPVYGWMKPTAGKTFIVFHFVGSHTEVEARPPNPLSPSVAVLGRPEPNHHEFGTPQSLWDARSVTV